MTRYEDDLPTHVVYDKERIPDTLGEVLAKAGKHSSVSRKQKNMLTSRISLTVGKKRLISEKTVSSYHLLR